MPKTKRSQTKRNETKRIHLGAVSVELAGCKKDCAGSDFQFKKLHAKAPQIKGIDLAKARQQARERDRRSTRERGRDREWGFYNKFQSKT